MRKWPNSDNTKNYSIKRSEIFSRLSTGNKPRYRVSAVSFSRYEPAHALSQCFTNYCARFELKTDWQDRCKNYVPRPRHETRTRRESTPRYRQRKRPNCWKPNAGPRKTQKRKKLPLPPMQPRKRVATKPRMTRTICLARTKTMTTPKRQRHLSPDQKGLIRRSSQRYVSLAFNGLAAS